MSSRDGDVGGFPKTMAVIGGFVFLSFGIWAMAAPSAFYESVALFEPYNVHFVQDLGAFQIGLGTTLLLASFVTLDALVAGLVGVGIGASAHVASHLVGLDVGGNPAFDIPALSLLGVLLVIAGAIRWRRIRLLVLFRVLLSRLQVLPAQGVIATLSVHGSEDRHRHGRAQSPVPLVGFRTPLISVLVTLSA